MRKTLFIICSLLLSVTVFANPKHEYRATWFTTAASIDWPKSKGMELQKQELRQKLDILASGNLNFACLQVRRCYGCRSDFSP